MRAAATAVAALQPSYLLASAIEKGSCSQLSVRCRTVCRYYGLITHRRSLGKRGGRFQRRLFVCHYVCMHDNFETTKRRTIKLGGQVHCTKISPEFEGQDQTSTSPRTKKRKTAESSLLTMHSRACALARRYAARSNRRYHGVPLGGDGLRRWENQRTLSSFVLILYNKVRSFGFKYYLKQTTQ